jgi:hypothetical protein
MAGFAAVAKDFPDHNSIVPRLARCLGEERFDDFLQVFTFAPRALDFLCVVLVDRQDGAELFVALFADVFVERHDVVAEWFR